MTFLKKSGAIAAALTLLASPVLAQSETAPPSAAPMQDETMDTPDGMAGQDADAMRDMMREMMMEMMPGPPPREGRRGARAERRDGERRNHGGRKASDMREHHGMRDGPDKPRRSMVHGARMKIAFAIVDADGDGALSLSEIQEVHARIFTAVDANGDGKVEMTEIEAFFHGDRDAPGANDN